MFKEIKAKYIPPSPKILAQAFIFILMKTDFHTVCVLFKVGSRFSTIFKIFYFTKCCGPQVLCKNNYTSKELNDILDDDLLSRRADKSILTEVE